MPLLLFFAILAGAGTALSPCVLPVLPALLSAGAVGGRRRPLGVVVGLSMTFTVTIVGVASLVDGVGLGSDPLRYLAVAVLLLAGLVLMVPSVAEKLEARMSRLASLGPRSQGSGFRSGLLVGAALGFVYTPCAGPILSAVITVSAISGRAVLVAIAYAFGSACVLLALTLGGRALFERVRRAGRGAVLQRALGAIMVLTALAILTGLDVEFDQYVAQNIPEVNLTSSLQCSRAVTSRLSEIDPHTSKLVLANGSAACEGPSSAVPRAPASASESRLRAIAATLPDAGPAPEFTETQDWFNTPGGRPLTLEQLRGKVVLIDFWTYTCINCIRTLPYLKAWYATYHHEGFEIVGVHTPEFAFEHEASNVAAAIRRFDIHYPVVQDNRYGTWDAYGNEYWPADYLIDAAGKVRYATFGEGDYERTETAIRALLAEAGYPVGGMSHPTGVIVPSSEATPETYLGTNRAQGWVNGPLSGTHDYGNAAHPDLALNAFAYGGTWHIEGQPATAISHATIEAQVQAKNVYLVLSSAGELPRKLHVLLDGRPISASDAGSDVHGSTVTVRNQRLYTLVSLPSDQRHRLKLELEPGISGYAFTFG